jgi:hypothetical protein
MKVKWKRRKERKAKKKETWRKEEVKMKQTTPCVPSPTRWRRAPSSR